MLFNFHKYGCLYKKGFILPENRLRKEEFHISVIKNIAI